MCSRGGRYRIAISSGIASQELAVASSRTRADRIAAFTITSSPPRLSYRCRERVPGERAILCDRVAELLQKLDTLSVEKPEDLKVWQETHKHLHVVQERRHDLGSEEPIGASPVAYKPSRPSSGSRHSSDSEAGSVETPCPTAFYTADIAEVTTFLPSLNSPRCSDDGPSFTEGGATDESQTSSNLYAKRRISVSSLPSSSSPCASRHKRARLR